MAVRFIPDEIVPIIHADLIRRYGGAPGIRDSNLLASALAQPRMTAQGKFLHRTIFEKAAAYGFHVCRNHPFVDGNKRVLLVLMNMFLEKNCWNLTASEEEAYESMIALASGSLTKSGLSEWLKVHSSRLSPSPILFYRCAADPMLRRYRTLTCPVRGIHGEKTEERIGAVPCSCVRTNTWKIMNTPWKLGLIAIVVLAGCAGSNTYPALPSDLNRDSVPKQVVEMTAQRYKFTPEEVHVKAGTLVTLKITALDGTHGFAMSDFGIDVSLPEKHMVTVQFYVPQKGEHSFSCSHLCGIGHFGMNGTLVSE